MDISELESLGLGTPQEVVLLLVLSYMVTQGLKQTKIDNRLMPWVSILAGLVGGVLVAFTYKDSNLVAMAVEGAIVGGFTSGLFDGIKNIATLVQEAKTLGDAVEPTLDPDKNVNLTENNDPQPDKDQKPVVNTKDPEDKPATQPSTVNSQGQASNGASEHVSQTSSSTLSK